MERHRGAVLLIFSADRLVRSATQLLNLVGRIEQTGLRPQQVRSALRLPQGLQGLKVLGQRLVLPRLGIGTRPRQGRARRPVPRRNAVALGVRSDRAPEAQQ